MIRIAKKCLVKAGLLRCRNFSTIAANLKGKRGLEIGGPSTIFSKRGIVPLYPIIQDLDNCNFSPETTWSSISEGRNFVYRAGVAPGYQFIRDAATMCDIENRYDFVLASHVLEHIANPLKALHAWRRLLKPDGFLLIVLPWKEFTFDHQRPLTEFSHIEDDFRNDIGEDDTTHVKEILSLHDLQRDPLAGTPEQFRTRSIRNFENRCLHHHVFSRQIMPLLFSSTNMRMIHCSIEVPFHLIALGQMH